MTEYDIRYIKKELEKELDHLKSLYKRITLLERKELKGARTGPYAKGRSGEKQRIDYARYELDKKFPGEHFDEDLLRLVGIMPNGPQTAEDDKKEIMEAIADKYYDS